MLESDFPPGARILFERMRARTAAPAKNLPQDGNDLRSDQQRRRRLVRQLRAEGNSLGAIAEILRIPASTVQTDLRAMGDDPAPDWVRGKDGRLYLARHPERRKPPRDPEEVLARERLLGRRRFRRFYERRRLAREQEVAGATEGTKAVSGGNGGHEDGSAGEFAV